ncbi:glycosyl hydrolase family 28-related protein [Pelagerythrobacter marinus]|uniref:glycosyl hydrolase family 28-related protein n=1 Tax=Pelagerythrobacter marinus TaxID=538382 RepID=UPI002AC965A2|nr:glycosyl hydrolase family 28-related protein [Pelagerythrobacter marinus]WPZ05480.1 glycosyl hydrolase family 28-related protein [Pelagerythrobacter marinus]
MNKYYETLTNQRGDVLFGYRAQVVDDTGAIVDIYQDRSGTRFTDSAGNIVNYATSDDDTGMVQFYWTAATGQLLQILDPGGDLARPPIEGFADNYVLSNLPGDIPQSAVTDLTTDLDAKENSADLAASSGAGRVGWSDSGAGATLRDVEAKLRERPSVLDYGADSTGAADSTAAFVAAYDAHKGKEIRIPDGTYTLSPGAMKLNAAGTRWVGASKSSTIIKAASGATGAICQNTNSAFGSTAYCGVEKLHFDLNGEDCIAVDLASVNNAVVRDCSFTGGAGFGSPTTTGGSAVVTLSGAGGNNTSRVRAGQSVFGPHIPAGTTVLSVDSATQFTMSANATGAGQPVYCAGGISVRCSAPLDAASYTNSIMDCAAIYMKRSFVAEDAANENSFFNCEAIACDFGFDVENGVDTIGITRGRAEGCRVGLRTGGRETACVGVRFEASQAADVEFAAGCTRPSFLSCHTATSPVVFLNPANSTGLYSRGGTFPQRDIEPNTSNPVLHAARQTFAAAGSSPASSTASTGYSAYFQDFALFRSQIAIEWENYNGGSPDNRIVFASADTSDNINISAYRRKTGTYGNVNLSQRLSARPDGLYYTGTKVLGAQQPAIADDASGAPNQATLNEVIAALRNHGIIAS